MPGGRTVVRRAPGKLFVAGEYAVLEPGTPAILTAVDRYVTVTVSAADTAGVVISSDLGTRPVHLARLDAPAAGGPVHVAAALRTVARLLTERGHRLPPLHVAIASGLHRNGVKYGLGSSGAVTVATIAAVAAYCRIPLTRHARYRLAMLATADLDPSASGGDLAASTFGGWLAYRAPDRPHILDLARRHGVDAALHAPWPGLGLRRLPPPDGVRLAVGWTGRPVTTSTLLSGLDRRAWRGTASHQRFTTATTACVHAATAALEQGDGPGLLHHIRRARRELARLDAETGLGIFTPGLTALCDAAEDVGGAAKPSGAGGGDCGIALLDAAAPDLARLRRRWAAAGVLPLQIRTAAEGR